jgi:hypothetical protein
MKDKRQKLRLLMRDDEPSRRRARSCSVFVPFRINFNQKSETYNLELIMIN